MAREKIERNISFDTERKKYYVNLDFGIDPQSGKQIKKMKTFDKLKEAQKCLRKHETQKDEGKIVRPKEMTLNAWLKHWMDTVVRVNRAKTTVYAYENILKHVAEDIGDMNLQKIKPQHIQKYYANLVLEKELSTNTARKHHDLLNSALKMAVKQEIIFKNPVESVEPPNVVPPDIHFYNREEVTRLLELCVGDRIELLIHLAGMLGLRREEILGLTWDCIDFTTNELEVKRVRTQAGKDTVVKKPKTNSSRRTLYLPEKIITLLKTEQAEQEKYKEIFGMEYDEEGYVIVWEDGSPMRPNYASDLFKKFIEDNDLPPLTLHGLRHSFATIASASGLPLYDIGRALGHSSTATTSKIYTHLLDHGHEEMMESLWGDGNSEI